MATLFALGVIVLGSAWRHPALYALVIGSLLLVALLELLRVISALGITPAYRRSLAGLALILIFTPVWGTQGFVMGWMTAFILLLTIVLRDATPLGFQSVAAHALTLLLIGMLGGSLLLIRGLDNGFGWSLFLLMTVQLADALALTGGVILGRTPLAPVLSPKKTWEGLIVGLLGALVGGVIFSFAIPQLPLAWVLSLALLLGLCSIVGDLLASAVKRAAQLEDFGAALPGHGGVLDRLDGYLVAAPVTWLFIQFWNMAHAAAA
jgi:phosphatidate cytidylyltransferase